jgi:hypothetical protein
MSNREADFESRIGRAAIAIWGDISRDAQEALFELAIKDRPEMRKELAEYLHERHPKTEHPPQPK